MLQFRADSDIDLSRRALIAELASDGVQHADCPAKSYYFPSTREAGLVQIAYALFEAGFYPAGLFCAF